MKTTKLLKRLLCLFCLLALLTACCQVVDTVILAPGTKFELRYPRGTCRYAVATTGLAIESATDESECDLIEVTANRRYDARTLTDKGTVGVTRSVRFERIPNGLSWRALIRSKDVELVKLEE